MNRKKLLENISLNKKCPICQSLNIKMIDKINSRAEDFENIFDLFLCRECGHRFVSKFPNEIFLNGLYENGSHYVIGQHEDGEIKKKEFIEKGFSNVNPNPNHWILKFVDLNIKGNYLEIGPGLCNLYKTFVEEKWKCEGLELQKWINGPGIVHNFNEINVNKKDLIVMLDVLEHTIDPVKLIEKLSSFQKINGKLFLTFPNGDSFKSKIMKSNWPMVHPLSHLHFFSKKSIILALKKNGYEEILIKSYSFVEVYRLLRNFPKLIVKCLLDLFSFRFKDFLNRLCEFTLNILDLINGDQLKVVAKKIK